MSANWQDRKLDKAPRFDSRLSIAENSPLYDKKSCSDDGTSLQSFGDEAIINEMSEAKLNEIKRR